MKKRILLLSIVLVSFTAFSFAADAPAISKNVISSFNKQFSNAHDIQWDNHAKYVRAQFTMNDIVLFAYFNDNGELLAITRFISPNQLPLKLMSSLKKDFTGYWISDLFEIQTESGTSYYVTLENADQITVLKSESTMGWNTYQKEKRANAE
jgi:hypothetical protein